MRRLIVLALVSLVVSAFTVVGVAQGYHGIKGKSSVWVTQVIDNPATGCVTLKLDVKGWKFYPGQIGDSVNQWDGGHYHVYVNGQYHSAGANGNRARVCGLATGATYQMEVVLAYDDHSEAAARSQLVSAILGG